MTATMQSKILHDKTIDGLRFVRRAVLTGTKRLGQHWRLEYRIAGRVVSGDEYALRVVQAIERTTPVATSVLPL